MTMKAVAADLAALSLEVPASDVVIKSPTPPLGVTVAIIAIGLIKMIVPPMATTNTLPMLGQYIEGDKDGTLYSFSWYNQDR